MIHIRARVLILSALALSLTGCVAQLKQRASFDLDCPEDQGSQEQASPTP